MLIPGAQLHGVQVLQAISAHCCSGVNGLGPAHGTSGVPHGAAGSASAGPAAATFPDTAAPIMAIALTKAAKIFVVLVFFMISAISPTGSTP